MWRQGVVTFPADRNFQVVIVADVQDSSEIPQGYVAIDDIVFDPDCLPDKSAVLPPNPPECDPEFQFR